MVRTLTAAAQEGMVGVSWNADECRRLCPARLVMNWRAGHILRVAQEMLGGDADTGETSTTKSEGPARSHPRGDVADPLTVVYPGMFFGKTQPQAVKLLLEKFGRPVKTRIIINCFRKGGLDAGGKKPAINLWGILSRNRETFVLIPKAGWDLVDRYDATVIAKMRKEKTKEVDEENEKETGG